MRAGNGKALSKAARAALRVGIRRLRVDADYVAPFLNNSEFQKIRRIKAALFIRSVFSISAKLRKFGDDFWPPAAAKIQNG